MQRLTAKEIKKIVIGLVLSDGSIDMKNQRFSLYSKHREYIEYVYEVLSQITGMEVKTQVYHDKRGYVGYKLWTRKHSYWKNIGEHFYSGRKTLTAYIASRVDEMSLAQVWQGDGLLAHSKNRVSDKIQNVGFFCLEAFPKEELELFQASLMKFGVGSSLIKVRWGYGYRVRIGGENLQKFISLVYPYILDCFRYKTLLFYKKLESANMNLPSAERFIIQYDTIEDVVRYSQAMRDNK